MNRVLRWLVLPAVLFGGMLVFSSSEADAFWGRRAACYDCGYTTAYYSPCSTGSCWSGYSGYTYASYVPSYNCSTCSYGYVAPVVTTGYLGCNSCVSGCSTGCSSCGY